MISEKCKTTYAKLNTFVTNVINRDVTPQLTNLNETTTSLQETKLDNKEYITTSFTPSKLKTEEQNAEINGSDVSIRPAYSGQLGFIVFRFECNTNEYYEFNIVVQSTVSIDVLNGEDRYATLDTGTHTIKISKSQLIIDDTSITYTGTYIDLDFVNNSTNTIADFYFSNKQWHHEATFFDKIYPIGSVHITTNSVNPSNYFDGEWERIQDTFLLASGTTYENGSTGGSANAVVVKHNHTQNPHNHTQNSHGHLPSGGDSRRFMSSPNGCGWGEEAGGGISGSGRYYVSSTDSNHNVYNETIGATVATNQAQTATNQESGVDGTGKNMPPYLAVYMWERVG